MPSDIVSALEELSLQDYIVRPLVLKENNKEKILKWIYAFAYQYLKSFLIVFIHELGHTLAWYATMPPIEKNVNAKPCIQLGSSYANFDACLLALSDPLQSKNVDWGNHKNLEGIYWMGRVGGLGIIIASTNPFAGCMSKNIINDFNHFIQPLAGPLAAICFIYISQLLCFISSSAAKMPFTYNQIKKRFKWITPWVISNLYQLFPTQCSLANKAMWRDGCLVAILGGLQDHIKFFESDFYGVSLSSLRYLFPFGILFILLKETYNAFVKKNDQKIRLSVAESIIWLHWSLLPVFKIMVERVFDFAK